MSEMLTILAHQLRNGEWKPDRWGYKICRNGVELWVGNGAWFFTGHNCPIHIPVLYRLSLWAAYRKGQMKQAMALVSSEDREVSP